MGFCGLWVFGGLTKTLQPKSAQRMREGTLEPLRVVWDGEGDLFNYDIQFSGKIPNLA